MSAQLPAVLAQAPEATVDEPSPARWPWIETAFTISIVVAAVLAISFLTVLTSL
jgi:hypothetical protein